MSINITVHAKGQPTPLSFEEASINNPFASLETVRKAENERRRKARLEQVRQQSRELAAKVRKNYQIAKQKQLACVQKVKQDELKRWKQQNIAKLQAEYKQCLEKVGEAHKAADDAEQCEVWFQERKAAQQAAALSRGKQAESKYAEEKREKENKKLKTKKDYKPSKSVGIQVSVPTEKVRENQPEEGVSSANTLSAFEQFKKSSRGKQQLLSPAFDSSDEDELLPATGKNKENVPSQNTSSKRIDTLYYNAASFTSPETLHNSPTGSQTAQLGKSTTLKPFTQVSDLVRRRRDNTSQKYSAPQLQHTGKDIGSYSSQKYVQFDDFSENTLSFPTSTALDRSILESPRKPVRKLVEHPKAPPGVASKVKSLASSPSKLSTAASTGSKVQYYDYNTKFRKEYDQPSSLVQRNEKVDGELNAMQEASRLERLQKDMLNARRQTSSTATDRSKVALEKLQSRKDYENLKAELDKLVRVENQAKALDVSKNPPPTLAQQRKQKESQLKRANEAVEDLIKQRVLITCPQVREPPRSAPAAKTGKPTQINVAAPVSGNDSVAAPDASNSDSCSTILLGYDPNRSTRAGIPLPTGASSESDRVAKLKDLLEQLNEQKKLLCHELKREQEAERESAVPTHETVRKSTHSQTDNGIHKLQQRQERLEQQQEELREREQEIRELEKQLKDKLNQLAKEQSKPRIPVVVETRGSGKAEVHAGAESSSNDSNASIQSGSEIPVKIVITVNDKSQKKITKTPKKSKSEVRKRKKVKDVVEVEQTENASPQVPLKSKQTSVPPVTMVNPPKEPEQSPISSTTSTIYRQPPEKIGNRMSQLLKQIGQEERSVPKHQLRKEPEPSVPPPIAGSKKNLNPSLMQYIIRLLGMSRYSIEQLGVSSSTTVSTPHDSVVDVSANRSSSSSVEEVNQSRLDKLRRFIDENYNFLHEIDETLKEQALDGTLDENINRVGDIWMRTLTRKEDESRQQKTKSERGKAIEPPKQQSPPVKESSLKSILKSPKKTPQKVAKIITPQGHVEIINLSDRDEQEVLEKYSQLTANCSKRINELSEMIQKVREEKRKLIENSLTSNSEQQESTKYMDLPQSLTQRQQVLSPARADGPPPAQTSPQSTRDDPVSEEINHIFTASRHIGVSKDSGIAMSRPVTSSDIRDSPDARPANAGAAQFESSEEVSSRDVVRLPTQPAVATFEPLLKDIPKVTARVLSIANGNQQFPSKGEELKEIAGGKRTKPPVAITRYSPQLDEATNAHELSTILEVETPMASKINISIPSSDKMLKPTEQLLSEDRNKLLEFARALGYEGFPNYEEYLRQKNLDTTRYDPEKTNGAYSGNLLLEVTDKSELLRYQQYPDPAPDIDVTEETLKDTGVKHPELESNSSSSASLPDVVAELKLRNIIDKSFNNSLDDSNRSSPDSGSIEMKQLVPKATKKPLDVPQGQPASETTGSLERDLNQLGLRWAATMLKKNQELAQQDHSSSSSLSVIEEMRRVSGKTLPKLTDSQQDPNESGPVSGRPLNLKEFIARELMIRTHSDLNSLSSSSSPCSLLLKSLLDISNINCSTPELLTQTTTDKNVQRTSTPVASKSTSSSGRRTEADRTREASLNVGVGLFSGESRISSVHMSSSSGGELAVPSVRLIEDNSKTRDDDRLPT
ncbi:putative leucine-rich repeat-containing protein DDB_G0290503 [Wyeomyia smithii]|uniref:putative leucine-rich repeat-containing protein DDB_G0290503 n=1 Tax=Wyeomyia smithii TaxID=174621 RepID=UPI002467CA56|nr:putative leucine-rich repeat-containing protein DDB_G0290503 [Wyeomyia smithii]